MRGIVFTIGHSTLPIEDFIETLKAHGVTAVVDVRTIAKSRHNPQFGEVALSKSLHDAGIGYSRLEKLGGLRRPSPDSINTGWKNKSFRGYADYMQTPDFRAGLEELRKMSLHRPVAIMCAEAVPWRCHRSLIGDALLVKNIEVMDIMNKKTAKPHTLTRFAKIEDGNLYYPADDSSEDRR